MGRKRRRGAREALPMPLLLLLLLMAGCLEDAANGDGEVGCLFSKNLCNEEIESCYNDLAFGRCIQLQGDLGNKDLYQYNLEPDELEMLRVQLERLEYQGYKWPHEYTQCVMQLLLDDLRYRLNNDVEDLCKNLKWRSGNVFDEADEAAAAVDDKSAIGRMRAEEPVAIVKFTPSQLHPHGEYADEFYYPPEARQRLLADKPGQDYDEAVYQKLGAIDNPGQGYQRRSRSLKKRTILWDDLSPYAYSLDRPPKFIRPPPTMAELRKILAEQDKYEKDMKARQELQQTGGVPSKKETADEYDADDYEDDNDEGTKTGSLAETGSAVRPVADSPAQRGKILTEPGAVLPIRRDNDDDEDAPESYEDYPIISDIDNILWRKELAGFKRRERLDVKKPGPLFSTNNYAFKTQSPPSPDNEISEEDLQDNGLTYLPVKKESNSKFNSPLKTFDNVDLDYVYVEFDHEFNSWQDGKDVVKFVATLLGINPEEFKAVRVGRAEVTFKVPKFYNATDIVKNIGFIRDDIQKEMNLEVVRAGIGDKNKLPSMLERRNMKPLGVGMFGPLLVAGVLAAIAASFVVLLLVRREVKSRAKLASLRNPDPEASKDYQELCRARMQAKQSDKLSESPRAFDFGRLIESGRSESNRSSTSSWGEEPQITTMDVATGHVVLSYMEDHLKNTEKLDEEWLALCAYEPDPCSTAIAEAEGNSECNRPGAALPYDHSRVVLNDLANLNNSDYINASTITDHDPRNPAYIATQGPLPQTAPDFWQLVWEQGSVVIVMLTRLTEEGQAMCHRYWPDEGSELYHIYEVHLVSEHIWCDDYLVRSFYLKNLQTGETRTVTQFHFLAWPQSGVPVSTKTLLEFRRKVNKSYRGRSCPIIVHCSDGAGRTGTYCLIDMVLNRMSKGAKEIDIAATLEHIRDQRAGMVSNKQQYEFVLMAVAEEVHAILKTLPIVADKSPVDSKTAKSDK